MTLIGEYADGGIQIAKHSDSGARKVRVLQVDQRRKTKNVGEKP